MVLYRLLLLTVIDVSVDALCFCCPSLLKQCVFCTVPYMAAPLSHSFPFHCFFSLWLIIASLCLIMIAQENQESSGDLLKHPINTSMGIF